MQLDKCEQILILKIRVNSEARILFFAAIWYFKRWVNCKNKFKRQFFIHSKMCRQKTVIASSGSWNRPFWTFLKTFFKTKCNLNRLHTTYKKTIKVILEIELRALLTVRAFIIFRVTKLINKLIRLFLFNSNSNIFKTLVFNEQLNYKITEPINH